MAVTLSPDAQKQALASIQRFCAQALEADISDIQARLLLAYFLKEVGPSVYNAGVSDAQTFLRDRLADLEATCYEPEFVYWPKESSVQRKR
ncbi:MAG: DUF2164 domain-containing protein [Gemmatimonadota bacterium]|nr:DUF2164 domain-containing protein [Gemmatimonadota bacterium]